MTLGNNRPTGGSYSSSQFVELGIELGIIAVIIIAFIFALPYVL